MPRHRACGRFRRIEALARSRALSPERRRRRVDELRSRRPSSACTYCSAKCSQVSATRSIRVRTAASEVSFAATVPSPRRVQPYLDSHRISCGAAVELGRLAARSLGYACIVRLVPNANEPDLVATITVGHREPATVEEQRLVLAAPRRYTDRGPYEPTLVPSAVLHKIRDAASQRGCWLRGGTSDAS